MKPLKTRFVIGYLVCVTSMVVGKHRYAQGVAYSESGTLAGPWIQEEEALNRNSMKLMIQVTN